MKYVEELAARFSDYPRSVDRQLLRGLRHPGAYEMLLQLVETGCPSFREEPHRDLLRNFARHLKLSAPELDPSGNIALNIPGKGRGVSAPPLILQYHCDTKLDPNHDISRNPIRVVRETRELNGQRREVLGTDGKTVFGLDNLAAGAIYLWLALDPAVKDHPPLRILSTWGEEENLLGAKALRAEFFAGAQRLINFDHEHRGEILNSCAGSATATLKIPVERTARNKDSSIPLLISLRDLPGGHSGLQIHESLGNALISVLRAFAALRERAGLEMTSLIGVHGGEARNSIPANAGILLWTSGQEAEIIENFFRGPALQAALLEEIGRKSDTGGLTPSFKVEKIDSLICGSLLDPLTHKSESALLELLSKVPHGVIEWDGEAQHGHPALSNNFAVVANGERSVTLTCMTRHADCDYARRYLLSVLPAVELEGELGENLRIATSPGWIASKGSQLQRIAEVAYRRVHGSDPLITSVHATVECGPFAALGIEGFDQTSLPIEIYGAHSGGECCPINALDEAYDLLVQIVKDCC